MKYWIEIISDAVIVLILPLGVIIGLIYQISVNSPY